ncbi:MAG TPA: hypothetical protein VFB06_03180 [Streptosporangiaceae bacterium]|nr:hypothetical protein [Streptosporangiaceae bacterium]
MRQGAVRVDGLVPAGLRAAGGSARILPSGIIARRHLLPAGRGARALVTSDGIGGTGAVRGRLRGGARPRITGAAAGWVMVFSSGQADSPQRRRRLPGLRRAAGRDAAAGDGNARGR